MERPFVDSDAPSIDVVAKHNLEGEHHMADPQETEAVEPPAEATAVAAPDAKKITPRQKRAKAQSNRPGRKAGSKSGIKAADAPAATARTGRRAYSQQERTQKLGQIEKSVGRGETLRSAIKQAGISEQTYYHWKKAAESAVPAGDLKDLLALEEENERLKKLLAERLRKENADLRKKLGMA